MSLSFKFFTMFCIFLISELLYIKFFNNFFFMFVSILVKKKKKNLILQCMSAQSSIERDTYRDETC